MRDTALPAPGSEKQLRALAARVHSQALDRSKPLWEMWLVQGLEGGRFALLSKTHHALVDGVAGVDLATVLFDLQPTPAEIEHDDTPWVPRDTPSGLDMAARGVRAVASLPFDVASRAVGAAARPTNALAGTREALEGIGEIVWAGLNPAPETPLNVEIGPHRRLVWVRHELSDFKRVKDAFGGTVNDVVLAVAAGALRSWLRSRGVRTEGLELRALVPVSIRGGDQHNQMGNRIAAMRAPLPVYVEDPVARLRVVRQAMDGLKDSKQALGAEVLAGMQALAPPTIFAQASRLNFSTRLFNLLVTNVPGPQVPLYVLGRRLRDLFPVAFLPKRHALAVAIMSYNGGHGLRPARRLRRDARPRGPGRDVRREPGGAARSGGGVEAGTGRSVAERELRVLGHLLRRPRGREDHRGDDLRHLGELAHELLHLLGDLRPDRAGRGGERERDVHRPAVDLDAVDQARARRNRDPAPGRSRCSARRSHHLRRPCA